MPRDTLILLFLLGPKQSKAGINMQEKVLYASVFVHYWCNRM